MEISTQVVSLLQVIKLEDIDQAYKDMDERKTIKSMIVMELKKKILMEM